MYSFSTKWKKTSNGELLIPGRHLLNLPGCAGVNNERLSLPEALATLLLFHQLLRSSTLHSDSWLYARAEASTSTLKDPQHMCIILCMQNGEGVSLQDHTCFMFAISQRE